MTTSIDTVRPVRPAERRVVPSQHQVEPIGWSNSSAHELRARFAELLAEWSRIAARSWVGVRSSVRPAEVLGLAAVAIVSCGFVMMMGLFATGDAPGSGGTAVVEVHAGDTLWGIAGRMAPDGDRREVVRRIVELNGLDAPTAEVGRHLVVPVKP